MKNSNLWRTLSWVAVAISTVFLVVRRLGEHVFEWNWTTECRQWLEMANWVFLAIAIVLLVKAMAIDWIAREKRLNDKLDSIEKKLEELKNKP